MNHSHHPAFPVTILQNDRKVHAQHTGLSQRKYIAIEAMKSMLTTDRGPFGELAKSSYAMADAMLLAESEYAMADVKPPPLDDWFIEVLRSMPDGERGFLKSWGLEDFAKAVAEKVCGAPVPTEAPAPTEPPTEATSPAPDDGGWIKWYGGECPVPPDTLVEKKIRAGVKHGPQTAQNLIWRHVDGFNSVYDIVEYRVFKPAPPAKFKLGDTVRKTKGSMWHGTVVGTYSTSLTPEGYAVESATESGAVQIYPASALEAWKPEI